MRTGIGSWSEDRCLLAADSWQRQKILKAINRRPSRLTQTVWGGTYNAQKSNFVIRTINVGSRSIETQYALGYGGQYVFVVDELDLLVVCLSGNYEEDFAYTQVLDFMEEYILPAVL